MKVLLSISGTQRFGEDAPETTELVTEGELARQGDALVLSYAESELTGMEGTLTTFQVEKNGRVTLLRMGEFNSQMVFEEGRQHTSLYETPFGELTVDIQTSRLRHNLSERGGVMDIKYSIAVEPTTTGRNCFKIRVKRKH